MAYTEDGWKKILETCAKNRVLLHERSIKRYYENPVFCRNCGNIIQPRDGVRLADIRSRKFCSHTCSAEYNNSKRDIRGKKVFCVFCGKRIHPKSKKYCSHKCQVACQNKEIIESWLSGKISGNRKDDISIIPCIREWVFESGGRKCSECGWSGVNPRSGKTTVQIDHIDGDSRNSRPDNLRLLCPNCHSLTPTYGGLNRGNGRKNRKR